MSRKREASCPHTCTDAYEQSSQHDHLKGACSAAEAKQDCCGHHQCVVHQEGLLPWGKWNREREAQVSLEGLSHGDPSLQLQPALIRPVYVREL